MLKKLKPILKVAGWLVALIVLYLAGVILYGTMTEYSPEPMSAENAEIKGNAGSPEQIDSILSFLTWNIGYAGLGKEMDFFYDGGKNVRPSKEKNETYFNGILDFIRQNDSIDFILIQEIDRNSKRSYETDQFREFNHALQSYASSFGINYDVNFVPVPYFKPMGKVYGGVASFSKYAPGSAERFQYPGQFPWPTRIFFLDRCFLVQSFSLANGKSLIVVNTHNSAFDESGEIKDQEMEFLQEFAMGQYLSGNYVIAGGDWNQCPPNFQYDKFKPKAGYDGFMPPSMSFDYFPPEWLWAYDPDVPTNRHVETELNENSFKTIIDYFVISPNIELLKVNAVDLGFEYSDHNPVKMTVRLK